jgi:hypothetical protein
VVARTVPFKPRAKPNEELPSISDEMQRQTEADQKDIKRQLEHAQQQLDLTKSYPDREWSMPEIRRGDTRSNVPFVAKVWLRAESDLSAALPRIDAMCHERTHALQQVASSFGPTLKRDHQYELSPVASPGMADGSPQLF